MFRFHSSANHSTQFKSTPCSSTETSVASRSVMRLARSTTISADPLTASVPGKDRNPGKSSHSVGRGSLGLRMRRARASPGGRRKEERGSPFAVRRRAADHPYAPAIAESGRAPHRQRVRRRNLQARGPGDAPAVREDAHTDDGFPVSEADRCPFSDVPIGEPIPCTPTITSPQAPPKGIILGTTPSLFSPYDSLTVRSISMVVRAIDSLADGPLPAPKGEDTSTWGQSDPQHDANVLGLSPRGSSPGCRSTTLDPRDSHPR